MEVGIDGGVILDLPVDYTDRYYFSFEVEKVESTVEELERWKASYQELKDQSNSTIDALERYRVEDKKEIEDLRGKLDLAELTLKNKEGLIKVFYETSLKHQAERVQLMEELRTLRELVPKSPVPERVPPKAFIVKNSSGETIAQGVMFDSGYAPIRLAWDDGSYTDYNEKEFVQRNLETGRTVHYD